MTNPQPSPSKLGMTRASLVVGITAGLAFASLAPAMAQTITSDGTTGTVVNGAGPFTITGGNQQLQTLFHSFGEFSPGNASILFQLDGSQNAVDLVVGRVTGANASFINGQLQLTGGNSPDLFLLNPNGISFGSGAELLLPGSFLATTAESVLFENNLAFSATNPGAAPLLTVSTPTGLQMGRQSGSISVQNTGHLMTSGRFIPSDRSVNPAGLQVSAGNSLTLVGNEVNFSGGVAGTLGGGHVEVGSVREGSIQLSLAGNRWIDDYAAVTQFSDITLAQRSLLDASGSQGSIQVQGRDVTLSDGSAALIQNVGPLMADGITIGATGLLSLTGNTPGEDSGSFIEIDQLGTGSAGRIDVSAGALTIRDGGRLLSLGYTNAPGSDVNVAVAGNISIDGFVPADPSIPSAISVSTLQSGRSGDIDITANNIQLLNSANINASTIGTGQGGAINITVQDQIEIIGNNDIVLLPSAISTTTTNSGNLSDMVINTARLTIRDGGFLGSSTLSSGNTGSVTVNASASVEISGRATTSIIPSRIASSAEILDPAFQAAFGLPPIPSGNAGAVTLNTPLLQISAGGFVSVRNDGPGSAGDLQVNGDTVFLNDQGRLTASTASGDGGNIQLNLQDGLVMRRASLISATSAGIGNGGNIRIDAPVLVGAENSDIVANALQGDGGNIDITTQGIFGLEFQETLTPGNDITASSQFGVNGTVTIDSPEVDPDSGLAELSANLVDASDQIATGCADAGENSFIATGRGGVPPTPANELGHPIWQDVRDLSTFVEDGETAAALAVPVVADDELTEITGWLVNEAGEVELVAASVNEVGAIAAGTCTSGTL
ncbi:MAG: filamentous hemagglutinin N-terminal domain-containing protein [Cyanobacteria bacterium P01_C01_bin.120]